MQSTATPASRYMAALRIWPYLAVAIVGILFGAGDQYLGSSSSSPVDATLSLISAPWLLLPFIVGCTQRHAGRATVMGAVVTVAGVVGYTAMILSPVEGVHGARTQLIFAVISSQKRWFLAALLAGPSYGLLGQRWRTTRSVISGLLAAAPLVLEPVIRLVRLQGDRQPRVYLIELAVGVLAACYVAVALSRSRKHARRPAHDARVSVRSGLTTKG